MQLPIVLSSLKDVVMMQTRWCSILNPFMANPSLQSSILTNVPLNNGSTTVNHLLGRKLIGWRIIRQRGPASIYDLQDQNQKPELTLILNSSAVVSIDLEVF